MSHDLYIENKEKLTITDVSSVGEFDETVIFVNLKEERLMVYGENLHIESLDLQDGKLIATGKVESLIYSKKKERKSIFERFRK